MSKFEFVSKYENAGLTLPVRGTEGSAGYDFSAAEDIVIPSYSDLMNLWKERYDYKINLPVDLETLAKITKYSNCKPTLIPTGVKCKLDKGTYLELVSRSSSPLKYWLICANSIGIIDSDYYNNSDNEGHIFFQVINLSPYPIQIKKGDKICQGIIKHYEVTENDSSSGVRTGGFGSTT